MSNHFLPSVYRDKLKIIEQELASGHASPGKFKGKKLKRFKGIFSIPLGRRYRAIFRKTSEGFILVQTSSHESYNKMNFA